VRVLQAVLATEAVDQRGIDVHELRPGWAVPGVAETHQQTGPGGRFLRHAAALPTSTAAAAKSFRDCADAGTEAKSQLPDSAGRAVRGRSGEGEWPVAF